MDLSLFFPDPRLISGKFVNIDFFENRILTKFDFEFFFRFQ